jgi:hypothetical protein
MRGEVRPVKPGDLAQDLLRRKSPRADHHKVAGDRLRIDLADGPEDVAVAEDKRLPRDFHVPDDRFLCHGFSVTFSLLRL